MPLSDARRPPDQQQYAATLGMLHEHLEGSVACESFVQVVEFDPALTRWYVRFSWDGRDAATIYFDLHQRALHYEVYFLPDPLRDREAILTLLLKANHTRLGAHFSIGPDDDLYITGRVLLEDLDAVALDRIIGELYELTERWSATVVALAFPRRKQD